MTEGSLKIARRPTIEPQEARRTRDRVSFPFVREGQERANLIFALFEGFDFHRPVLPYVFESQCERLLCNDVDRFDVENRLLFDVVGVLPLDDVVIEGEMSVLAAED